MSRKVDQELLQEMTAIFRADLDTAFPNGAPTPADLKRVLIATAESLERKSDRPRIVIEMDPNNPLGFMVYYRLDE